MKCAQRPKIFRRTFADLHAIRCGILDDKSQASVLWQAMQTQIETGAGTACGIIVTATKTYFVIAVDDRLVETACQELGWNCMRFDGDGRLTWLSDGAETFLDAVAKRIRVGDIVPRDMQWLLGELIAETALNVVARKRPPQVSQRLLTMEPFSRHYEIDRLFVAGPVSAKMAPPAEPCSRAEENLLSPLARGYAGGIADRGLNLAAILPEPKLTMLSIRKH